MRSRSIFPRFVTVWTLRVVASLFVAGGPASAWADTNVWTSHGPDGGWVNKLMVDPKSPATIFACTLGGLFKTTDAGATWIPKYTAAPLEEMAIDPFGPQVFLPFYAGVLASTDGGDTWSVRTTGLPTNAKVNAFVFDPVKQGAVYAATNNVGVYKSTDGGNVWTVASTGLTNLSIQKLAVSAKKPVVLYAVATNMVFKSTDGAATWTPTTQNRGVESIAIDPITPSTVYAGLASGGVVKSIDSGETWNPTGTLTPIGATDIVVDPKTPSTVYATFIAYGVYKSTDGGDHWTHAIDGLLSSNVVSLAIAPGSPNVLFGGVAGSGPFGVYKSSNGAGTWSPAGKGLASSGVLSIVINPKTTSTLYAATSGSGLFKSIDSGTTWTMLDGGLNTPSALPGLIEDYYGVDDLAINPKVPSTLYAINSRVYKSEDSGSTWNPIGVGLPSSSSGYEEIVINPEHPDTLYLANDLFSAESGVYKTTDGGATWALKTQGFVRTDVFHLAMVQSQPDILYASTGSGFFKTTNGGDLWTQLPIGGGLAFAVDPVDADTVYVGVAGYAGSFLKSVDGGKTFNPTNTGLTVNGKMKATVKTIAFAPSAPGTMYVGADCDDTVSVFRSTNRGASWTLVGTDAEYPPWFTSFVLAIAVDPKNPNRLYAGTQARGVFDFGEKPAAPPVVCGDADGNGKIQTSDALFALRAAVQGSSCPITQCDADGNGTITTSDALRILRAAVGQPVTLSCAA